MSTIGRSAFSAALSAVDYSSRQSRLVKFNFLSYPLIRIIKNENGRKKLVAWNIKWRPNNPSSYHSFSDSSYFNMISLPRIVQEPKITNLRSGLVMIGMYRVGTRKFVNA